MQNGMLARECDVLAVKQSVTIRNRVKIPIKNGNLIGEFISFHNLSEPLEHFAIGFGAWETQSAPLVRVHSECITGDTFYSTRCDCGKQLDEAMELTAKQGGVIIYLRQEGRGIGLFNKIDAYELQMQGYNTYEANRMLDFPDDMRSYVCAAEMLGALSISTIRLLSNNPKKASDLVELGIDVAETKRTGVFSTKDNLAYLLAKSQLTHHNIHLDGIKQDGEL